MIGTGHKAAQENQKHFAKIERLAQESVAFAEREAKENARVRDKLDVDDAFKRELNAFLKANPDRYKKLDKSTQYILERLGQKVPTWIADLPDEYFIMNGDVFMLESGFTTIDVVAPPYSSHTSNFIGG